MRPLISKSVLTMATLLTVVIFTAGAQNLNTAIQFTRSEQYDKADELLKQLIQREPSNSKNYFYLGENYLLDYFADTISNSLSVALNNARDAFQKGVDAGPNDPLNYIGLAKIAAYLGNDQLAAEHRTKARSFLPPVPRNIRNIRPPAPEYAFTLAKIAESHVKFDDVDTSLALPLIREAISIDNKNSDVYLIAGDILNIKNDASAAIRFYNLAEMYDPQSPTANMKIGSIYVRGRALTTAIPYFEKAIQLDANYAPAYRELGQLYSLAQRFEQAKENFEKYLSLTAGNIPARIRYVNALFYARDYDGVIENVEEIFRVDRSRTYMNRIAGYSSFDKNPPDYDKALSYMETLFASMPEDRLLPRDYQYMARIITRKNVGVTALVNESNTLKNQINSDRGRLATVRAGAAGAAERESINATIARNSAKADSLDAVIAVMNKEIDRGFEFYFKFLETRPDDRLLLQEITAAYSQFRNYVGVAKTLSMTLGPLPESNEDYMTVGRAYYNAARYQSADSIFNVIIRTSPNYVPAHLWIARTQYNMDPSNLGAVKPRFDKVVEVAQRDSVANKEPLAEAIVFIASYYMSTENYSLARAYYNRLADLPADNNDNKIRAYSGIGLIEQRLIGRETTNEGRLAVLARSAEAFNRIIAIDPNNAAARNQLNYIREYEASVRRGINPNEIRGVVTDAATNAPIPFASIRVKDTAAEAMTNQRGEFRFEMPAGMETLIFSARDYRTIEVPITSSRVYNVTLSK